MREIACKSEYIKQNYIQNMYNVGKYNKMMVKVHEDLFFLKKCKLMWKM